MPRRKKHMPTGKTTMATTPKTKQTAKKTPAKTALGPRVGDKAPAFKLPATALGMVSLAALKGKVVVLYFYPKDDTSGCTAEACGFRDAMPQLAKRGVTVIGVSRDSLAAHEKFTSKYALAFPLASDESGAACEAYGVWVEKSMYGRKYMGIERATYLIDAKGVVRAVWRKVSVPGHVDEVKQAIAAL